MKLNLHFLEAEGSLDSWHAILRTQAKSVADLITATVPPRFISRPVDVLVQYLPEETIPELGIGGSCFRRGLVTINLDPANTLFEKSLTTGRFTQTLAHELHHSMRHEACGYGYSLGEAFISEGLADSFAQKLFTGLAPVWTNALVNCDWAEVINRAELELDHVHYDHSVWFFGAGELPRWTGYTIGYHLVQLYGRHYPDKAEHGMIDVPHSDILLTMWEALKMELQSN
ncbi:DUF2268 domain-containing putative Zn-dependent protease [Phyllobacterium sp. SB3]|uniref:DUF2268 domain-containing putative Zn-dependent protease n=1 Tax=Phyllobacterium sp. SB3 TaxID=3156073 RepID=UPI0032AEAD38